MAELEEKRAGEVAKYGVADLRYMCGFSANAAWQQAVNAWYQMTAADTLYKRISVAAIPKAVGDEDSKVTIYGDTWLA